MLRLAALLTVACALGAHPTLASPSAASPPDGIYRNTITRQDILKAFSSASEELVRNNVGVFTWRFSDGTLSWRQQPRYSTPSVLFGKGRYTVNANVLVVRWSICGGCPSIERIRWTWDGRKLRLHKNTTDPGAVVFWNLKALVNIG